MQKPPLIVCIYYIFLMLGSKAKLHLAQDSDSTLQTSYFVVIRLFFASMQGHSFVFLSQCRILGITTHTLQVVEELSKIQDRYLGTEKELASLFASR